MKQPIRNKYVKAVCNRMWPWKPNLGLKDVKSSHRYIFDARTLSEYGKDNIISKAIFSRTMKIH